MVKVTVPLKPTKKASTVQKPSNSVTDQESCSICLDELTKTKGKLPCGHEFCFSCIERWSKETNKCPLCKARFETIQKNTKHAETSVNVKKKDIPIANPPPNLSLFIGQSTTMRILSQMIRQQVLRTQRLRTQGTNTENAISLVSDDESEIVRDHPLSQGRLRVTYHISSDSDSASSDDSASSSSSDDSYWSESSDDDSSSDWEP